jgi:hypothetical protein
VQLANLQLGKYKYILGLGIFLALSLFSLFQAYEEKTTELVTMLLAVIGYFAFMVVDRLDNANQEPVGQR